MCGIVKILNYTLSLLSFQLYSLSFQLVWNLILDLSQNDRLVELKYNYYMKKDIHPKYEKCIVKCACGETFETRSTKAEIFVEICSACHPFYTGKKKIIDSTGRVDRFKRMLEKKKDFQAIAKKKLRKRRSVSSPSKKSEKSKTVKNKDSKK